MSQVKRTFGFSAANIAGAPVAHAATHENGGADEVSVIGLSGLLADDQHVLDAEVLAVAAALVHAARHQNGGADEISVAALSGLLADDQHVLDAEVLAVAAALVHAARHLDGGADEIEIDDLAGAAGAAGEIVESDGAAMSFVEPDGRYAPLGHEASHQDGGADELEIDDLPGAAGAAGEIVESDGAAMSFVEPDGRYDPKAHVLATTGPHSGALPLIDLEVGVQGEIVHRGAADWEALAVGGAGEVLTSGGAGVDVSWAAAGAPGAHAASHESGGADEIRNIEMEPGLADETGDGLTSLVTHGEATETGEIMYMKADGKYWLSDADAAASMPALVLSLPVNTAGDATGLVLHKGYYRNDTLFNWTPGNGSANLLYAHTTPGAMVQLANKPAGAGDQLQVVGYVVDANTIYFNPSYVLGEIVP